MAGSNTLVPVVLVWKMDEDKCEWMTLSIATRITGANPLYEIVDNTDPAYEIMCRTAGPKPEVYTQET